MNLLEDTIRLAELAKINADDVQSIGRTWRWFWKVRNGEIPNPGIIHVLELRKVAENKLSAAKLKKLSAAKRKRTAA